MNKKQKNKKTLKNTCTTSINVTPPAPPAPMSQQQLNHQINKSEDMERQQNIIEELMERVGRLEGTVSVMEGELAVIRNINNLLSCQLDEADSYS